MMDAEEGGEYFSKVFSKDSIFFYYYYYCLLPNESLHTLIIHSLIL
jgi:hypothetical protein